jgi:hypothetical protein
VSAALAGAKRTPDAFFVPALVELAGHPNAPLMLIEALSAHTPHLTGLLPELWRLAPAASDEARRRRDLVLRGVARSDDQAGREWFVARLNDKGTTRRDVVRIINGLASASHEHPPAAMPGAKVAGPIRREATRVTSVLEGIAMLNRLVGESLPPDSTSSGPAAEGLPGVADLDLDVLRGALRDELESGQRHVERLMGLAAAPQGTMWVMSALADADESRRSAAIELIEVAFGRGLGRLVLAVIDPTLSDHERLTTLATVPDGTAAPEPELAPWLAGLAEDRDGAWEDPWLSASALRTLPRAAPHLARQCAEALAGHPDLVVAETAAWVLDREASAAS